jgi:hypothetical protein
LFLGTQLVLAQLCDTRNLDLEEAAEFLSNPYQDTPRYPYKEHYIQCHNDSISPPQETRRTEPTASTQQGEKRSRTKGNSKPVHNKNVEKFNKLNIPPEIRKFLEKQLKTKQFAKHSKNLRIECLNLIGNSLAKSTWNRYKCAFKIWKKFCADTKSKENCIDVETEIMFTCWCSENTKLKAATISMYLSAITHCLSLMGVGGGQRGGLLASVSKGLKNSQSKEKGGEKQNCSPITIDILRHLRNLLLGGGGNRITRLSAWTAALVAFWGCFRLGELLCGKQGVFDKYSDLQWRDVELSKNSVKIRIKSSKTSGAKPVFVQLGKLKDKKLCPRHAVKQLMSLQKEKGIFAKTLPVFRKGGGKNLRPVDLVGTLATLGSPGAHFSGKSFRSGIPSILAAGHKSFDSVDLKNFGRWKSSAFRNYIRGGTDNMDLYNRVTNFALTN